MIDLIGTTAAVGMCIFCAIWVWMIYLLRYDNAQEDASTETHDGPPTGLCGRGDHGNCDCGRHV